MRRNLAVLRLPADVRSGIVHTWNRHRSESPESVPAWPTSPEDVPDDATLVTLIDRYHHHLLLLTALRFADYSDADLVAELGRHALAALALSAAVIEDLRAEQQRVVREARRRGVSPADIARALDPGSA